LASDCRRACGSAFGPPERAARSSYDADRSIRNAKVSRMPAFARRLFAVLLFSAASAAAHAASSECVADVEAARADIARAQDVQRTREMANDLQLYHALCQGRLDLLDARFALADEFEACRRDGVAFPEKTVRAMTDASDELTDLKAAWIRTCGPQMKD
jgi:hypothetical protein